MVRLEIIGVRLDVAGNVPLLLLRESDGMKRILPIYIGAPEAASIQWGIEGREPPRPLTHDLIENILGALGAVLDRVVITTVEDGVFFADLHLLTRTGPVTISARPSDAIALAVRAGCTVFCDDGVLISAGRLLSPGDPLLGDGESTVEDDADALVGNDDSAEILGEFRDFIENINPEDFQ